MWSVHLLEVVVLLLLVHLRQGWCVCFFPGELQGVWVTQATGGGRAEGRQGSRPPITYQEVTIQSDAIVQWGACHQRLDHYVMLTDRSGSTVCYRCIQLEVVTPQVVQVWSTGLETCYTSEEAALRTCPSAAHLAARTATHLTLYKSKTSWGEDAVRSVECPLNGRYTFTYRRGDADPSSRGWDGDSCDQPTSHFSNCPHGFGFSLTYRDCTFPSPRNGSLQCLGSWVGHDGNNYLAVWDSSVRPGDHHHPVYKCGMFREEAGTGVVFLAFSEDSTCTSALSSPTAGYENFVLKSVPPPPLPPDVSSATCAFPRSLHGHWHHTYVADDTVVFKDYHNYRTYTARCVKDMDDGERYIVYTRTHCGEWNYNCLWLKRRSANVLEFMLGLYPRENFDLKLCDLDKFGDMTSWTTQGKSLLEEPTTCPIVGNYEGVLSDAPGYCAQLYSDCETPQLMYYTVSDCRNTTFVYEREDLPSLTSEAVPWMMPEQKVSTSAVLSIADDQGRRVRRQASIGQFRVANARTTTLSWLWGTPSTPDTTTTSSTTTTTTKRPSSPVEPSWTHLPLPRPPPAHAESSSERNVNRYIPDSILESQHQPEPPRRDRGSSVGFWPSNQNQPDTVVPTLPVMLPGRLPLVVPPVPERQIPDIDVNADLAGVPGRATWVPGTPPGFQSTSSSTQQTYLNENSPEDSLTDDQYSAGQPSSPHGSFPAIGINRQPVEQSSHSKLPLKQEREYQCLGQWEEEGRVYALTYRRDIRTYECFVGIIKTGGVVFIKEAGARCSRGIQPEIFGMKLHRKESCTVDSTPSQANPSSQQITDRSPATRPPWLRTTRPWKPITGRPSRHGSGCEGLLASSRLHQVFTLSIAFLTFTFCII
ncbi:uncharacterized protein [Procambarus clarkii]|uniref:uncharacterized protein isoform X1 n=1 Tax=Procambarus clarkii TaxID=6728 RepID=UPI003743EB18